MITFISPLEYCCHSFVFFSFFNQGSKKATVRINPSGTGNPPSIIFVFKIFRKGMDYYTFLQEIIQAPRFDLV